MCLCVSDLPVVPSHFTKYDTVCAKYPETLNTQSVHRIINRNS